MASVDECVYRRQSVLSFAITSGLELAHDHIHQPESDATQFSCDAGRVAFADDAVRRVGQKVAQDANGGEENDEHALCV